MGYTEAKCDELMMMMDREQLKVKGQRVTILRSISGILDFKGT